MKKSNYQLAIERMEKEVIRATTQVEKLAQLYSQHKKGTK
jgi:hypothetical protein